MTKVEFLKITHRRTNNRIKEWLNIHTPNNVILRYLWVVLSCFTRAIVAVVGCMTYFITLYFIDVEYSIKYMEVEIEVLELSPAKAHEYLKQKEKMFKESYDNWFYSIFLFKVLDLDFEKSEHRGSYGAFFKIQR